MTTLRGSVRIVDAAPRAARPTPARDAWRARFAAVPEYGALAIDHDSRYSAKATQQDAREYARVLGVDVRISRRDTTVYLERV